MYLYRWLSIERFRGIRHLVLDDLGPVNVITGLNNVGKSSILEAIFLNASGALAGQNALTVLRAARGQDLVLGTGPGSQSGPWDTLFYNIDPSAPIRINSGTRLGEHEVTLAPDASTGEIPLPLSTSGSANRQQPHSALTVTDRVGVGAPIQYRQSVRIQVGPPNESGQSQINFQSKLEPAAHGPFVAAHFLRGPLGPNLAEGYSKLRQTRSSDELLEALRLIDGRIRGLEVLFVEGESSLHADIDGGPLIPFNLLGDGATAIARYLIAMVEARGGAVLLDEVGAGVHHTLQGDLWSVLHRAAARLDVQIFATTHSDEAIRGAIQGLGKQSRDLRLYRVWRDNSGDVSASQYSGPKLRAAVEMNAELR